MLCYYAAGYLSGVFSFVLYYPLDNIKSQQQFSSLRFSEAAAKIRRHRGWAGFYRGASLPLLANGIVCSAFFGTFGNLRDHLIESRLKQDGIYWTLSSKIHNTSAYHPHHRTDLLGTEEDHKVTFQEEVTKATFEEIATAAGLAGFLMLVVSAPTEHIKTKLQTSLKDNRFNGAKDCFQKIYEHGGIKGLYRGVTAMMLRNTFVTGFRFAVLCKVFQLCEPDLFPVDSTQTFLGWGVGGLCAWTVGLPFDAIRLKLQADDHVMPRYGGMRHVASRIYEKNGIRGFYRGFWNVTLKMTPANMLSFVVFSYVTRNWCPHPEK